MQDAAICIFGWDFADEGIAPILEFAAESGLTSLFFASAYHAGWFVLPHNPRRTCYMTEDGVVYFHPQSRFFESTSLKPQVAQIAATTDWLAEVAHRMQAFGLRLTAWTVCNHNTRLGISHPEHTVRNALGDSYPHALTPASPAVRNYVRGLALNLASQYPLQSIFLEALSYGRRRHGHHHERDLTPFGALEIELLDISFSSFDMASAEAAGIDAEVVKQAVAAHLTTYMESVPTRPRGMPETIQHFYEEYPLLKSYRAVLDTVVASLVAEIHDDIAPYDVMLEGVEPLAAYDWHVVGAYGKTAEQTAEITREGRYRAADHQRVRVGFRLGFDPLDQPEAIVSADCCRQRVLAAAQNGADAIYFYNYSESPRTYLSWIKPALTGILKSPSGSDHLAISNKGGV